MSAAPTIPTKPTIPCSKISSLGNKLPNLCTVINGLDMKKRKYGYYYGYGKYGRYYGYGKKYGYGYGYGQKHN